MKFKLFKIKSKITLVPTKDNGYIMANEELEKELMKGKGGGGGDGSLKDILLKFIDEQRAVNVEQKKFNSEVKEFMGDQKKFNYEVKEFIVEQKVVNKQQAEFNTRIEAKVNETSEKLENVIKLNKLKA
ncbi:MAG: hypothetical protein LBC44_01305 [Mycoplasmataceae bacterium]|jgi:hypothetical protein|nr:hypothetical protein [Mycoplasmataceae bacterium]